MWFRNRVCGFQMLELFSFQSRVKPTFSGAVLQYSGAVYPCVSLALALTTVAVIGLIAQDNVIKVTLTWSTCWTVRGKNNA